MLTLYFLLICRINGALLLTRCESWLLSQSFVDSSLIWHVLTSVHFSFSKGALNLILTWPMSVRYLVFAATLLCVHVNRVSKRDVKEKQLGQAHGGKNTKVHVFCCVLNVLVPQCVTLNGFNACWGTCSTSEDHRCVLYLSLIAECHIPSYHPPTRSKHSPSSNTLADTSLCLNPPGYHWLPTAAGLISVCSNVFFFLTVTGTLFLRMHFQEMHV